MKKTALILVASLLIPPIGLPQGKKDKDERGNSARPALKRIEEARQKVEERVQEARERVAEPRERARDHDNDRRAESPAPPRHSRGHANPAERKGPENNPGAEAQEARQKAAEAARRAEAERQAHTERARAEAQARAEAARQQAAEEQKRQIQRNQPRRQEQTAEERERRGPDRNLARPDDKGRMAGQRDENAQRERPRPEAERAEETKETPRTARETRRPEPREVQTEKTREVLQDRGRRNETADRERARKIDDKDEAKSLITSILGGAAASRATDRDGRDRDHGGDARGDRGRDFDGHFDRGRRLPPGQVGRTDRDREETVNYLVRRLSGHATPEEAPIAFRRGIDRDRDHRDDDRDRHDRDWDRDGHHRHPHYFDGNWRVVWYSARSAIPAILLASRNLQYVDVTRVADSPYRPQYLDEAPDGYFNEIPSNYRDDDAYAVSYQVDPNSAVSQDDILFLQGSTNLADAYSYDLIVDMAEAMTAPELAGQQFVIEGHASAEGGFDYNLRLSQERAERIARDLVDLGVSPGSLIPVGYGETEAEYPANAREDLRALDRRVMVFRKL